MDTLFPKLGISIVFSIIFLLMVLNKENIQKVVKNAETKYFFASLLAFRFIPIIIIFLILKYDATSDVKMFHTWANTAKNGYFVYRDFASPYAPLFPYITALPLFFYNSANSILLLMVIIEAVILTITFKFYSPQISKNTAFYYSLLYLTLPATFVLSVISGQEDIWMWGVIVSGLVVFQKTNDSLWVGIILGIGMIVTKVIFVFALPIAVILLPNKIRFIVGLAIIGLPTLAILVYFGGDTFLLPIQEANNPRTPNIWSILNPFLNVYKNIGIKNLNLIGLVSNILLSIMLSFSAKAAKIPFIKAFPLIWIFSNCWLMLIQQSSLSNYCFVFLMPLIFTFSKNTKIKFLVFLLLFSVACTLQPPIWWGQKMPIYDGLNDILKPINLLEYSLEIFIVGCIIYFCKIIVVTLFTKDSTNAAIR